MSGDKDIVYLLSRRGITQVNYASVLKHLSNKFTIPNLAKMHELIETYKMMATGPDVVTLPAGTIAAVSHGELIDIIESVEMPSEQYFVIAPAFHEGIVAQFNP